MKRIILLSLLFSLGFNSYSQTGGTSKDPKFKGIKFTLGNELSKEELTELENIYEFEYLKPLNDILIFSKSSYTMKGKVIDPYKRFSSSKFFWANLSKDKLGTVNELGLVKFHDKYLVAFHPYVSSGMNLTEYVFFHKKVSWKDLIEKYFQRKKDSKKTLSNYSAIYLENNVAINKLKETRQSSQTLIEPHELIDIKQKCFFKLIPTDSELLSSITFKERITFKNDNGDTASIVLYPNNFQYRTNLPAFSEYDIEQLVSKLYPSAEFGRYIETQIYVELSDSAECDRCKLMDRNVNELISNINRPILEDNAHKSRLAKQENRKKELVSKYGEKFGNAIANRQIINGMTQEMVNLSLGNAWNVKDTSIGGGLDIYHMQSKLNSKYHMKIVLKNKKVIRVSTY